MTSVATPIWNEIARTQRLETSWARKAFALDPDQMAELESQEYHDLLAKGLEHAVAASLLDVKPLLLENRAISRYTQFHPELRAALPEICSVTEAVILASMDRPMTPTQQKQLCDQLHQLQVNLEYNLPPKDVSALRHPLVKGTQKHESSEPTAVEWRLSFSRDQFLNALKSLQRRRRAAANPKTLLYVFFQDDQVGFCLRNGAEARLPAKGLLAGLRGNALVLGVVVFEDSANTRSNERCSSWRTHPL